VELGECGSVKYSGQDLGGVVGGVGSLPGGTGSFVEFNLAERTYTQRHRSALICVCTLPPQLQHLALFVDNSRTILGTLISISLLIIGTVTVLHFIFLLVVDIAYKPVVRTVICNSVSIESSTPQYILGHVSSPWVADLRLYCEGD